MANKQGTYDVVDSFIGDKLIEARYIGQTKYFDAFTDVSGTLPLTYTSRASQVLKNYRLYGTVSGSGVVTGNLWNEYYPNISSAIKYVALNVGDGTFTLSTTSPRTSTNAANLFFFGGDVSAGPSTQTNGVWNTQSRTVEAVDGYVTIAYRVFGDIDPQDYKTMLNSGSMAAEYEPAGYKIPLTNNSTDYTLYIGSSKLGEDDFVDYASQKVYCLKEVHKDTVIMNGIEWDILGYDHDEVYKADGVTRAQHTVTIQAHDILSVVQFDASEAFYYAENGLTAGTYYFTIDPTYDASHNTYKDSGYTFTLTQDVPAKGVLTLSWGTDTQASGMKISSYATAGATTAIESNIAVSEGTTGTNLGELTSAGDPANNLNSIPRARYSSNNWKQSAMRQYLNSNGAAGTYWEPQTKFDRPPSWNASLDGFLYNADSNFISALGTAKKVTAKNTVSDGGGTETTSEKVFLLSMTEAYCGGSEGTAYSFFKNYSDLSAAGGGADTNRIKYRNNAAKVWWLRSPYPSYAYLTRVINTSGVLSNYYSYGSIGVAPACCIILDDLAENDYLKSVFLKPVDPPSPLPAISAVKGENILSSTETVGTVTVKGRIKEIET